jgi:hypothetical protein
VAGGHPDGRGDCRSRHSPLEGVRVLMALPTLLRRVRDERLRRLGGGLRFMARLAMHPQGCALLPLRPSPEAAAPATKDPGRCGGSPRGGLWSENPDFASGTGSERAKVANVAEGTSPASQGPPGSVCGLRVGPLRRRCPPSLGVWFGDANPR